MFFSAKISILLLVALAKNEVSGFFKRNFLKKLKLNKLSKPDFVAYRYDDLPNKYVTATNLPVLAWIVGSNAAMEECRQYCENIIFENFIPDTNK